MSIPPNPEIYHIVHLDRLLSIISDGYLWCDTKFISKSHSGTNIGMDRIKNRRKSLSFSSYPELNVGDCVPFYFCPRSIMLYLIYKGNNEELAYHGGQEAIIHLEADLKKTVDWAQRNNKKWVFTLSNAGTRYFEDRSELSQLDQIDWTAVKSTYWQNHKENKQAEFLIENQFPWELVSRIGVYSESVFDQVKDLLKSSIHNPKLEIIKDWYY
jgi:ssDNA thymidine ADP-ribosyltransferase, DarT